MRTKAVWLIVVPFLLLARPTPGLLAVGGALAVVGLLIRGWSAGTIEKSEVLATTGPYAFTRNPLYLGSFIIGVGLALAGGHWIWPVAFIVFFGAVYVGTIKREAEQLHGLFGSRYAEYATHVPAFVPRPIPYRPADGEGSGFRWSRYLRYREWEALIGTAAAFAALALRSQISG